MHCVDWILLCCIYNFCTEIELFKAFLLTYYIAIVGLQNTLRIALRDGYF